MCIVIELSVAQPVGTVVAPGLKEECGLHMQNRFQGKDFKKRFLQLHENVVDDYVLIE